MAKAREIYADPSEENAVSNMIVISGLPAVLQLMNQGGHL